MHTTDQQQQTGSSSAGRQQRARGSSSGSEQGAGAGQQQAARLQVSLVRSMKLRAGSGPSCESGHTFMAPPSSPSGQPALGA
jgi:hypothetical protein